MRIAIITATFPPIHCGVGDYTYHFAAELARAHEVTVLTTNRVDPSAPPGVTVRRAFDGIDARTTLRLVPEVERLRPDRIVVQYDPQSYGARYGFNPYLPVALSSIRRRVPRARIAVVGHETFPAPSDWKRALMSSWQAAQLVALARAAHVLVFPVEPWARRFSRWFPRATVVHVPVGNNIPRVAVEPAAARKALGLPQNDLILGWLGRTAPTRNLEWIRDAIAGASRAGLQPFVLHAGFGGESAATVLEGVPSRIAGLLSPHDLSLHLTAMDICLAPFSEGLSARRTSTVTAFAHGLPVVASAGPATDDMFLQHDRRSLWLVHHERGERFADAVEGLASSPSRRVELGRAAKELADTEFSWTRISESVLEALSPAP